MKVACPVWKGGWGDVPIARWITRPAPTLHTAERIRHRIGSSWSEGSGRYSLQDGYYQLALTDGRLAVADYWQAQGTLLRDDQAIGTLEMRVSGASGRLVLAANDGEIVVKSWE